MSGNRSDFVSPFGKESEFLMGSWLEQVRFDDKGLVTAVAIDDASGDVLMLAHMNLDALRLTMETGRMTYWSRSRKSLWVKGETSGNTQRLVSARLDCDGDALLFRVVPEGAGAACHEGYRSCFFRELQDGNWRVQGSPIAPGTKH
jgi:phosphoribosyl-AMP cyclohydrolase